VIVLAYLEEALEALGTVSNAIAEWERVFGRGSVDSALCGTTPYKLAIARDALESFVEMVTDGDELAQVAALAYPSLHDVSHISAGGYVMTDEQVKACRCDNPVYYYKPSGELYLIQHSATMTQEGVVIYDRAHYREVKQSQDLPKESFFRRLYFTHTKRKR
jgi:hypothetical protein